MLVWLIAGLLLMLIIAYSLNRIQAMPDGERKKTLLISAGIILALLLFFLAITGRLAMVGAVLIGMLPWVMRSIRLFGIWQIFNSMNKQRKSFKENMGSTFKQNSSKMSAKEARDILGVDINSTKEEIFSAYRRLMKAAHPDQGGSDGLAKKVNEAKKTLLDN